MNAITKILFWMFQWIYSKVLGFVYGGATRTTPTITNSILLESASSLAKRIRNRNVTSVEVVRCYINRMKEVNEVLNCVADERFEDALTEAEKADELIRSGVKSEEELERVTPFLGVPFTVPESTPVKELLNTMGTPMTGEMKAESDCVVVSQMKEAGGILVACTNIAEGCLGWETNNPVYGRTNNPYNTNRSVGGPFGGEACLIASSGSPLGVAPSVGLPCAFNGVFGHKPTASICPCPMSRNSADLLPALKILTKNQSELNLDEPVDVKKLKFYYVDGDKGSWFISPANEDIKETIKRVADHFGRSRGASVERVDLKRMKKAFSIWMARVTEVCVKKKVNPRRELVKSVFGKSRHSLAFLFAVAVRERMQTIHTKQTEEDCKQFQAELQALLKSNGVLICPSQPTTAHLHNESLTKCTNYGYAGVFEVMGFPTTYCPVGLDEQGLPMSLQIVAGMNRDNLTIAVAQEIEKLFGGWKPPPSHGTLTLKNSILHDSYNGKLKAL